MVDQPIKNIETLIEKFVGTKKKLVDCKIINMTVPGENYAGVMLRVDLTFEVDGKEEKVHAVAKTPNFNVNEMFKSHIPAQYKKEIGFYREIVPTLQKFYKEEELPDIFPKLYAGRFNLTEDPDLVDEHAVILMENLEEKGYRNIDRHVGFGYEDAKIVLKDLAIFHAAPIAIKLKKSHVFDIKIKKFADILMGAGPPKDKPKRKGSSDVWIEVLKDYNVEEAYLKALQNMGRRNHDPPNEPFATIGHNDLWTNNTMQIVENGKIVANKLIDFQMLSYQSPARDLLFFLCTSTQNETFDNHFDDLIKFYHQEFIAILNKFKCKTDQFDWKHFKEELDTEAPKELTHIIMLMIAVLGKKGEAAVDTAKKQEGLKAEKISLLARERVARVLNKFGKRNWI